MSRRRATPAVPAHPPATDGRRRPGPPGGILFTPQTAPWRPRGAEEPGPAQHHPPRSAPDRTPEPAAEAVSRWCDELDVTFPVSSWQLALLVDEFGGDVSTTGAILRLSPGRYHSLAHLLAALPLSAPDRDHRDPESRPAGR